MTAKLIKPVVVVRQDEPSVMETLAAGTRVDFDPVDWRDGNCVRRQGAHRDGQGPSRSRASLGVGGR